MVRLDYYLFGYRRISVETGHEAKLATLFIRERISAICEGDSFLIRESDFPRFRKAAGGRVRYFASDTLGLLGKIKELRHHIPSVICAVLMIILNIWLSTLVWDIRVEYDGAIDEGKIISALKEAGLSVGRGWGDIRTSEVEARLLLNNPELAFAAINREGTVAYVTLTDKDGGVKNEAIPPTYSNIVAEFDGVVEEITVFSGTAMVTPGTVVKRGDILISGISEGESGSSVTRAEGRVIAHRADTVSVDMPRCERVISGNDELLREISIEILGFRLIIFKNYGNLTNEYDIIEAREVSTLFGVRLPLAYIRQVSLVPVYSDMTYTDAELPRLSQKRLEKMLSDTLSEKDLIKLTTHGGFTDDGYRMTAEIVCAEDIGREVPILLGGNGDIP